MEARGNIVFLFDTNMEVIWSRPDTALTAGLLRIRDDYDRFLWLAERRKYLADTGADTYGIPMEPQPASRDYWGAKIGSSDRVSIGPCQR